VAAPLYQLSIAESRYVPDYVLALAYLGESLAEPVWTGEANDRDALRLEQASRALERARLLAPDLYILDSDLGQIYLSLARESATTERGAVVYSGRAPIYLMRAAAMLNAQVTVRPYHRSPPRRLLAEALHDLSPVYLPQCIGQVRAALLLDPTDPATHYVLGRYLAEAGQSAEAVFQMRRASRLRMRRLAGTVSRAHAALLSGDFPSAGKLWLEADAAARGIAVTEYSIAELLHGMKRDEDVRTHLKRALRFWAKYPDAAALLRQLASSTATPSDSPKDE
jgi:tetratricopeptide (TPR) repeat protein